MPESKRGGTGADNSPELEDRQSEATSDETLSELEENEKDVASSTSKPDPGPSPDGAFDESNEINDAGPM